MIKVYRSAIIHGTADKVWGLVRDFNNLPQWHPKFSRGHIEGGLPSNRIGCVRNFDIVDNGSTIRERLLELSDVDYSFRYCIIDSPLPVENYIAQLTLYPVTADNSTVGIWTAEFDVTNGDEAGVIDVVGNGTFGKAFEVLNESFAAGR